MKMIFEVGDRLRVKEKFNLPMYKKEVRALAGKLVTVREVSKEGIFCWLEETKGSNYDDIWEFEDFVL